MGGKKMCPLHMVAWWLLWVGGINWGLVGVLNFNLVATVFGSVPLLERAIYVLVGLAAVAMLLVGKCKGCGGMLCKSCAAPMEGPKA